MVVVVVVAVVVEVVVVVVVVVAVVVVVVVVVVVSSNNNNSRLRSRPAVEHGLANHGGQTAETLLQAEVACRKTAVSVTCRKNFKIAQKHKDIPEILDPELSNPRTLNSLSLGVSDQRCFCYLTGRALLATSQVSSTSD